MLTDLNMRGLLKNHVLSTIKGNNTMEKLIIHEEGWDELIPDGLPIPSSTLISGPGGSGKPLIGFAIVHEWLKAGGNVIFIPVQYPKTAFLKASFKEIYDINIKDYHDQTTFIQFSPEAETYEQIDGNTYAANLLKPMVWNDLFSIAEQTMNKDTTIGTLVFASALNILLFSPTYHDGCLEYIEQLLRSDRNRSYLFSASTSAFREDIRRWEDAAENLLFTEMKGEMRLFMKVEKMQHKNISSEEVYIPLEKEMLEDIRGIAEHMRMRRIPQLKKI
jgi:archaellum biogenesis ATPase FlaH